MFKKNTLYTCSDGTVIDLRCIVLILPIDEKGNTDIWTSMGRCLNIQGEGGRESIIKAWKAIQ